MAGKIIQVQEAVKRNEAIFNKQLGKINSEIKTQKAHMNEELQSYEEEQLLKLDKINKKTDNSAKSKK